MNRIHRLRRDESGRSYVFIGMSMLAFLSASMLAIDVGMLMTARSQAQNSADAGALAGAQALIFDRDTARSAGGPGGAPLAGAAALICDSYTDRSAGGPAVTSAIRGSQMNQVMSGQVSVTPGDV